MNASCARYGASFSLRDDHGLFVWALNLMGYDLFTSFATVAACINNMGLGFGETASTFGTLTEGASC
jgi:Trk-type K+ transport system membrane component